MPGIPGIPGAPGSPGRDGFKGEKGSNGKRGLQGMGIPGKIGPRGLEGPKGDKGENGTGIPGNTGPRGSKGSKGENGRKGEIGRMGSKGSAGIPGYAGPRGPKGSKGETGIGTKGEKGDATNIDPRQLANWKQCAWREGTQTDNGKIKVSKRFKRTVSRLSVSLAQRRRKKTQVENLRLLASPVGHDLRALALTCDDLRSLWSRSNLHASQRKFFTVWPPYASQHKSCCLPQVL